MKKKIVVALFLVVAVLSLGASRSRYNPKFATQQTVTMTPRDTTSGYTDVITAEWTAVSGSGGSNGIYNVCNPIFDLSNAYGLRARMDLRDSAEVDLAVNQLHSMDGLINLDDGTLTITDNVSVYGAALHSVGITAGDIDAAGATGGTLNLYYGVWGDSVIEDFTAITSGHQILTHAGTFCDYGFWVYNSGTMLAGLHIKGHASNSPSSFGAGVLMDTASGKMTYGVDMDAAGIVTAEIRGSNGETIDNVTNGSWDLNGARAVVGSINLVSHENEIVFYENEAVTY